MKLPRVDCSECGRGIAAGPVAGRPGKGRLWRHDPPGQPHVPGQPLVSCDGSLRIVDLPDNGQQLEIDVAEREGAERHGGELMALF